MNAPAKIQTWPTALATYIAARAAEDAYDCDAFMPAFHRYEASAERHGQDDVPPADHIPAGVEAEIERLQDLRSDAEDVLMAIPSPDATAFARKFLVAYGDGREGNQWHHLLEAEARRFTEEGRAITTSLVDFASSPTVGELIGRYHEEMAALDAATDQDDIDWLADASFSTLEELSATPARGAWELADKLQAVVDRFADFDPPNMRFVKDALEDARRLSSDPDFAVSWVRLWYSLGGAITADAQGGRWIGMCVPVGGTPDDGWSTITVEPHLRIQSEAEWRGATKALQTLLEFASDRAKNAVHALAPIIQQEG